MKDYSEAYRSEVTVKGNGQLPSYKELVDFVEGESKALETLIQVLNEINDDHIKRFERIEKALLKYAEYVNGSADEFTDRFNKVDKRFDKVDLRLDSIDKHLKDNTVALMRIADKLDKHIDPLI